MATYRRAQCRSVATGYNKFCMQHHGLQIPVMGQIPTVKDLYGLKTCT